MKLSQKLKKLLYLWASMWGKITTRWIRKVILVLDTSFSSIVNLIKAMRVQLMMLRVVNRFSSISNPHLIFVIVHYITVKFLQSSIFIKHMSKLCQILLNLKVLIFSSSLWLKFHSCYSFSFFFCARLSFRGRRAGAKVIYPLQPRYVCFGGPSGQLCFSLSFRLCKTTSQLWVCCRFTRWHLHYTWLSFARLEEIPWNFTR